MSKLKIKLSILDQSPIMGRGKTSADALDETTQAAILAEKLGYTRYWLSEHHNARTMAGSTPEILIAHVASRTKRIRVGSGGIMLPNHSALKVAESFRLLEALYPNRIDLGLGRAPGTDRLTAAMLNPSNTFSERDFLDQLHDLGKYLEEASDKGTVFERVKAYPTIETMPERWLLTSSGDSALFAAKMGLPMSYAHFINPNIGRQVMDMYKASYQPSKEFPKPKTNLAVFAFCSDDAEVLARQQAQADYWFVSIERGVFGGAPTSYEDIKDEVYSDYEKQRISVNRERIVFDTPEMVQKRLGALVQSAGTEELMIISYAYELKDRLRSIELIADMFDLN